MRDLPGGETDIVGKATVDFANTGKPATVYLLNAQSGAGADRYLTRCRLRSGRDLPGHGRLAEVLWIRGCGCAICRTELSGRHDSRLLRNGDAVSVDFFENRVAPTA